MEFLLGAVLVGGYTALNSLLQSGQDPREVVEDTLGGPRESSSVSTQATQPKYKWRVINGVRTKVLDFT